MLKRQESDKAILKAVKKWGSVAAAARELGVPVSTLRDQIARRGLKDQVDKARQESEANPHARPAKYDFPPDDELVQTIGVLGSMLRTADHYGIEETALRRHIRKNPELALRIEAVKKVNDVGTTAPPEPLADRVHAFLKKKGKSARVTVDEVADHFDMAPGRIRKALDELRDKGIRIPVEDESNKNIALERIVPDKAKVHPALLEGDVIRVGLVSDTHLSSNEEALDELHLAYDIFEREGIEQVWHPGDWVCGRGIFRTQDAEIKNHTFESQVEYAVANYPKRDGIETVGVGGNHDLEGEFGRIGADPVEAIAKRRDDIRNLGPYSAYLELPNGAYVHLLHGRGGMSYAYSYKAQKLVDGYAPGRKPALLCVGHWHVAGWLFQRGVHVFFPGCFEWRSPFLERLGLSPAVGFWILELTLGDDGSLVKVRPEFNVFHEGRVVRG